MRNVSILLSRLSAGALLLGNMQQAFALQLDYGADLGVQYSNNVRLVPDNEEKDWITTAGVNAHLSQSMQRLKIDIDSALDYNYYLKNTFSDQRYFRLNGTADVELIKKVLTWKTEDHFTQAPISTIDAATPDNIQNINGFLTGPSLLLALSPRQSLAMNANYSNIDLESTNASQQRYSASADWKYQLYTQVSVGLGAAVGKTSFDNNLAPDFTDTTYRAIMSITRGRFSYDVNAGVTRINRDGLTNEKGFNGNISLDAKLTRTSTLSAYFASSLTDTGQNFLQSQQNPNTGNFQNLQASSDVLRNNIVRISYIRAGAALNGQLWAEYRKDDYKVVQEDREVKNIGIAVNQRISSLLTSQLRLEYLATELTDINRDDRIMSVNGELEYHLSPSLSTRFGLGYNRKNANNKLFDYDELTGLISLVYRSARSAAVPAGLSIPGSRPN